MTGASIVAYGAISGLGQGLDAASAGEAGAPARVAIAHDEELARANLARPFAARAALDPASKEDRATALLTFALGQCARALDEAMPGWRAARVGLALGTSSGGMRSAEEFFAGSAHGDESVTYYGPFARASRTLAQRFEPATQVLGACASATFAIGLATRWLAAGRCDLVLAGGYDAVSVFVAAGFEVLRATTASPPPRPFRVGRDGMSLGEGAAVLALAPPSRSASVYIAGFGASTDAVHLTAPDRTGSGVARAANAALEESGLAEAIDLVSAHATATPFNDAAEARALERALGQRANIAVVHPFKAQIGHTLGAAGALEALACVDAITRGLLPAAAGEGALDPDAPARLLGETERANVRAALKLSAAFGGSNAALVIADRPSQRAPIARAAHVTRAVHAPRVRADLAARLGVDEDKLARADTLTQLVLSAVSELEDREGPLAGSGILVGHALATLETNATYYARIRERGARFAEPRRFPYTSPNAPGGDAAVAFGLTGPSFAVCSGLHGGLEALAIAADLVAAGDCDRIVVVAVDEVGSATARFGLGLTEGAVATLVTHEPAGDSARIGAITLARGAATPPMAESWGHRALLPLVGSPQSPWPRALTASSPPGAFAQITLLPICQDAKGRPAPR